MNFTRIDTTSHPLFAACRKIYCNNFPYQEQRSLKEQERVFKTYPNFHFMALTEGDNIVGIITYWRFINCYFAEHLAIGDQYKGNGYGSLAVEYLKSLADEERVPVLLEIEIPDNPVAQRRAAFYTGLDFDMSNITHFQPPFHKEHQPLELKLMCYPYIIGEKEYSIFKEQYYSIMPDFSEKSAETAQAAASAGTLEESRKEALFTDLGLSENILKAIAELNYKSPTPVQKRIIPQILTQERDIVCLAQTGTGKTAAFGLPILHRIEKKMGSGDLVNDMKEYEQHNTDPNKKWYSFFEKRTQALVLSPTRELCRQIAAHNPKQLIVFDIYENNAHAIGLELKDNYPDLNLEVLIGSVRDSRRINQVFQKYRPEVVYHAAAHKHVPLMEDSPCESIKNNAIGTYKTAYAAMMNGCKRFVLISTDKAVNPTNIMGASKRLCEMIIQTFDRKIKEGMASDLAAMHVHPESETGAQVPAEAATEFVAVRFGNVLGSNGSVIPRFKSQIAKGGPVTVTHPDIIRYFMLIPEACKLVLEAGTMGQGGEIYVFDMGQPVKIVDLAKRMISLSGAQGIEIKFTGLRDGEKLYEEVLNDAEFTKPTYNPKIKIAAVREYDYEEARRNEDRLHEASFSYDDMEIVRIMKEIVPEFKSQHSKYEELDGNR